MNTGIYAALSGSLTAMRRLEVVSNNLANANTAGFKGDHLNFQSVLANAQNPTPQTPVLATEQFYTDYGQGTLQKTDNALDVALDGEGFFAVNTPQGIAYTRQGNFHRGSDGKLLNADGYEVQGQNGAIRVNGSKVQIGPKGAVNVDGAAAGSLQVVTFAKPYALKKLGGGLYIPDPQAATPPAPVAASAEVKQGYVEGSNVSVVAEMARMIEASRYFESCSKMVKSYDDLTAKAANDLGKV